MKKILNVMIDLETLSRHANAAIISIAAVPFFLEESSPLAYEWQRRSIPCIYGETEEEKSKYFYTVVDATSCALSGMHFEEETVNWWAKQSDEAKSAILNENSVRIREALEEFDKIINKWKNEEDAELRVWAQGSDFDFPILKWAYRNILKKDVPWTYRNQRDARTFMLTECEFKHPSADDLYRYLPNHDEFTKHSSIEDAKWSASVVVDYMAQRQYSNIPTRPNTEK